MIRVHISRIIDYLHRSSQITCSGNQATLRQLKKDQRVLRQLHRRMVRLLTAFLDLLNGSSRVGAVSCEAPNAVAPDVRRRIGDVFKQGGRRLEACHHCKQMSRFEPHTIHNQARRHMFRRPVLVRPSRRWTTGRGPLVKCDVFALV